MKSIVLFIILVFCLAFIDCSDKDIKFDSFIGSIQNVKIPLTFNDTTVFNEWDRKYLIDTNYVKEFNLVSKLKDSSITFYPLSKISEYKCSAIGKYTYDDKYILIIKSFTTDAGNGGPVINLLVYNKAGYKTDEKVLLTQDAEDPFYKHRAKVTLNSDMTILYESTLYLSVLINDEIKPQKNIRKEATCFINTQGRIESLPIKETVIFENTELK
jgi:hypothetical protein